ncbi:MAG TPA: glycosyltransferase family 39 protein [Burkholderiales bacterium]|nr:glycosyltransferase family 39 protein [Burkholderiales bacterium]
MRPALAVAALAAAAYLPSLAGVFHFDDYNVIVNYLTVHSWQALFERAGDGVRPLLKASYTLNWTLGFGFSFLNILIHAVNAVLLYLVGKDLFKNQSAALVAALLFALHPAQTEAVTYISGRSSSLMALFYLGALLAYLRGAHWSVSSLLFLFAMATRETAVTLPAALLLCELCRTERPGWKEILRRQGPHWALLLAGGLFLVANQRYFDLVAHGYTERSLADNLLTQVGGVSYLVLRLVSLHGYNIDPALPTLTQWTPALGFQAVLFVMLFILGIANLRSRPWIAFGVLWFFLQLAPTNSVVPRLDVANERQLYLACWGLFLALSVQFSKINLSTRKIVASAGVVLTVFLATSIFRQLEYRSEIALWESSVALAPWNARAHNNLGYAYQLAGRGQDARREYETALVFEPRHAKARLNLMFLPPE